MCFLSKTSSKTPISIVLPKLFPCFTPKGPTLKKKNSIEQVINVQTERNFLNNFDKIYNIDSFLIAQSFRVANFLICYQIIVSLCLGSVYTFFLLNWINSDNFQAYLIKFLACVLLYIGLLGFSFYLWRHKQRYSTKKLPFYLNLLILSSILLLIIFNPTYTIQIYEKDESFISPAIDEMNLILFLFYTNLLKGKPIQFLSLVFRIVYKIFELYLFTKFNNCFQMNQIFVETMLFFISGIYILFRGKTQMDLLQSIKAFQENKELWVNILNSIPNNVAILLETQPHEVLYNNQPFSQFFNLNNYDENCYFKQINEKLGVLNQISEPGASPKGKKSKEKPMGDISSIIDKVYRKELMFTENEPMKFYVHIQTLKKKLQVKIKEMKINETKVLLMVIEDISQLDLIYTLKQNNEYKLKLLSSFSHELKTPLNGSIPLLENVFKEGLLNETNQYLIDCSIQSLKILENVLNDYIDYARILSKQLSLHHKEFHLTDLLHEIQSILVHQIKEKGLELIITTDPSVPEILYSDFSRLRQILISLLLNSLKFTNTGTIKVSLTLYNQSQNDFSNNQDNSIKFQIEDTGIGIPHNKLNFINDCLQNNDILKMHIDPRASFLGLIIAHKLASKLGPKNKAFKGIHIESNENQGTIVTFLIDYKPMGFSYPDPIISHVSQGSIPSILNSSDVFNEPGIIALNKTRDSFPSGSFKSSPSPILEIKYQDYPILCVDDDPFNLLTLELMLKSLNKTCVKAFNGEQALSIILGKSKPSSTPIQRIKSFPEPLLKLPTPKPKTHPDLVHPKEISIDDNTLPEFELILMDYAMPLLDGVETTKKLKILMDQGILREIPIIGCSAFNSKSEKERCFEAGMSGFIEKPVRKSDLEEILKKW